MKRISLILSILCFCAVGTVWAADSLFAAGSLQNTLEYNRTNQASTWVNPDTGQSSSTVPTRTFQNAGGQPCREFTQTITVAGEKQQGYGTACRQPDGSWQIVNDESVAASSVQVQQQVVYVSDAPVRRVYYDPYPYAYRPYYPYGYEPYYFPFNLALSFGYIYTSGYGGGRHWGHGGRGHGRHR